MIRVTGTLSFKMSEPYRDWLASTKATSDDKNRTVSFPINGAVTSLQMRRFCRVSSIPFRPVATISPPMRSSPSTVKSCAKALASVSSRLWFTWAITDRTRSASRRRPGSCAIAGATPYSVRMVRLRSIATSTMPRPKDSFQSFSCRRSRCRMVADCPR